MLPVSLSSLWLPILLSAAGVFFASFIIHMVLPYHRTDFKKMPSEDAVMDAMRRFSIPPGDYLMPCHGGSPASMKDPAFLERMNRGPVAMMTIMKAGPMSMGPQLMQWFVFTIVVSVFAGYLTSRAVPAGAVYLEVSRFASTTAFLAYALGHWPATIWYKRSAMTSLKGTLDGLIYGFVTGGFFGWLWPR